MNVGKVVVESIEESYPFISEIDYLLPTWKINEALGSEPNVGMVSPN